MDCWSDLIWQFLYTFQFCPQDYNAKLRNLTCICQTSTLAKEVLTVHLPVLCHDVLWLSPVRCWALWPSSKTELKYMSTPTDCIVTGPMLTAKHMSSKCFVGSEWECSVSGRMEPLMHESPAYNCLATLGSEYISANSETLNHYRGRVVHMFNVSTYHRLRENWNLLMEFRIR